jgi:hypothetical protein
MDWEKIRILVDGEDDNDPKVHKLIYFIMRDFVDRHKHRIVTGRRLSDGETFGVISLGVESFGNDLEELKKKDIPVPGYLEKKLSSALTGPDLFEVISW